MADLNWNDLTSEPTGEVSWDSLSDTPTKPNDQGDVSRGFTRAFAQVPELAYGTGALAAMSAEKLFGEGGLSTAAKNYFGSKYAEKHAANEQYAPTVEFTDAWDAISTNPGKMADWIQDSAGYVVGQGLQTIATGGIGALAGKMTLGSLVAGSAAKAADKLVAAEVAKRGLAGEAAEAAAAAMLPAATAQAARNLSTALGSGIVLTGQNLGMEAGDIYGGLLEESKKTGKPITGSDLIRAWGAAGLAAGTETVTDLLGLGALTGRIKIGNKAIQDMTGIGGRAARAGVGAGVGSLMEGGQEWVQTGLEQWGAGSPLDTPEAAKERINAAAVGALGGTIMGGGAGALAPRATVADIDKAPDLEAAVATAEAALAAPVEALEPNVDDWKGFNDKLYVAPTGEVMSDDQLPAYDQYRQTTIPARNAPLIADATQEAQTRLDTVQADEGTTDLEARRPKTILKRAVESIDDNELRSILANPETSAVTARAVHVELAARERAATPTAEGTGGTNELRTTMGGTTVTIPDAAPAKNNTVSEAVAILRTPVEQRVPADTMRLRNVAARIGSDAMAKIEQFVKGPFNLTREERVATERLIASDARTAAAPAATPATLSQPATQQQLADNEAGLFSQPRKSVFRNSQLRSETGPDIKGEKVTRNMRKALALVGRITGTKVVFEFAPEDSDGAVPNRTENTIHINTAARINPMQVMGHEVTHVLKDRHAAAWGKVRDTLVATMPDKRKALDAFAADYWGGNSENLEKLAAARDISDWSAALTPEQKTQFGTSENSIEDFLLDEMVSDLGGQHWSTEKFWTDVFAKIEAEEGANARSIIERLVMSIKEMLGKFLEVVRANQQGDYGTVSAEQIEATRDAITTAYAKLIRAERRTEPDGEPHNTHHRIGTSDTHSQTGGTDSEPPAPTTERQAAGAPDTDDFDDLEAAREAELAALSPARTKRDQRLFFEVAPNPNDKVAVAAWKKRTDKQKRDVSNKVVSRIIPGLLADLQITGKVVTQLGGWMDDTNPSFALVVSRGDPLLAARAIGYVLDQEAVYALGLKSFTGAEKTGIIHIDIAGKDAHKIYMQIRALDRDAISGHSTIGNEMLIGLPIDRMNELEQDIDNIARKEDVLVSLDEGYGATIKDYGYDIRNEARDSRKQRTEAGYVDKWRAEARAATGPDAAGRGSSRESPVRGGDRPNYGTVRSGTVSAVGVHYSQAERQTLSSRFFGTGMKGEERARIMHSNDERIKRRLYFYTNEGSGITPESGVGSHAHSVLLNNLYDLDVDSDNLIRKSDPTKDWRDQPISPSLLMNYTEAAVIDAGYDGYVTHQFGRGGAVVLLGDHSVPVRYEGLGARPDVPVAEHAKPSNYKSAVARVTANKSLPSGQMSGADWKNLVPALMKGLDVSHLDDNEMYYKNQIVQKPEVDVARRSETRPVLDVLQEIERGKLTMDGEYGYNTYRSLWKEAEGLRAEYPDDTQYDIYKDLGGTGVIYGNGGYNRYSVKPDGSLAPIPASFSNKDKLAEAQAALAAPVARRSETRPPSWYYSPLARAAEAATMQKAPASGWKDWLKSLPAKGVKPDEIKWSGIEEWLDAQGKMTVTKDQVNAFLSEFGVKVETILRGERNPIKREDVTQDVDVTNEDDQEDIEPDVSFGNFETDEPDEYYLQERAGEQFDEEVDRRVDDEWEGIADDIQRKSRTQIEVALPDLMADTRRQMGDMFPVDDALVEQTARNIAMAQVAGDTWQEYGDENEDEAVLVDRAFAVLSGDMEALEVEARRRARAEIDDTELMEELTDRERQYHYDDSDSPATRTITVTVGDDVYEFIHNTSYGEHYVSYNRDEVPLARNNHRTDDADIQAAILQYLMEEQNVSFSRQAEYDDSGYVPVKWEGYATDKNRAVSGSYREIQLTLPVGAFGQPKTTSHPGVEYNYYDNDNILIGATMSEDVAKRKAEELGGRYERYEAHVETERDPSAKDFQYTTHWQELNVIGHARFDEHIDEDGKRVMVLQEIQGDWGQQRREGLDAEEKAAPLLAQIDEKRDEKVAVTFRLKELLPDTEGWKSSDWMNVERLGSQAVTVPTSMTDVHVAAEKLMRLTTEITDLQSRYDALSRGNIPSPAPFIEKTVQWAGLVMKRMIAHAVEYSFDKVVWTSGAQQVERWASGLRQRVDTIAWEKTPEGIHIVASQRGSERANTRYSESALSDAIGKVMAQRIVADPNQSGEITGDDITISDTGMAGFYDKMLPNIANEILKKLDKTVRVKEIEVHPVRTYSMRPDPDSTSHWQIMQNGRELVSHPTKARAEENIAQLEAAEASREIGTQQGFEITDKIRESAAAGIPLFSERRRASADRKADNRRAWYYSQLGAAVNDIPKKIRTGKEAAVWLQANASKLGIKKDELNWSGVLDYLQSQPTPAGVNDWLRDNGVKVKDVVLGEESAEYKRLDAELDGMEEKIAVLRKALYDSGVDSIKLSVVTPQDMRQAATGDTRADLKIRQLRFDQSQIDAMLAYGRALNRKNELFEQRKAAMGEQPKYEAHTLPGGKSGTYRELLLVLPSSTREERDAAQLKLRAAQDRWLEDNGEEASAAAEAAEREFDRVQARHKAQSFRSSHYPQPNILAHLRFEEMIDADGRRVMFLQEVQGDWGQKGRRDGFAGTERTAYQVVVDGNPAGAYESMAEAEAAKQRALKYNAPEKVEIRQVRGKVQDIKGVPAAPFVTDTQAWTALALKRAIAYAVDNGFDRVAWTTGEQQSERYSLSTQVRSIEWSPVSGSTAQHVIIDSPKGLIRFDTDNGKVLDASRNNLAYQFVGRNLEDIVGKEVAKKITGEYKGKLEGDGLKIGGEGMKGFYDQIVPQVARKLGATLGTVNLGQYSEPDLDEDNGGAITEYKHDLSVQPGFDITDEMRQQARIGMPLFSTQRKSLEAWAGNTVVRNPDGSLKRMYHGTSRDITKFRPQQADAIFLTDQPSFAGDFADLSRGWMLRNYWTWMTPEQIATAKAAARESLPPTGREREREMLRIDQSEGHSPYLTKQIELMMPSEANILPLYVRAENPFDFRNPEHVAAIEAELGPSWMGQEFINGEMFEVAQHIGDLERGDWNAIESPQVQEYIRKNHDSFYVRERGVTNLAVFSPNQVKSASGNDGSYSREDDDIRRSETRQVIIDGAAAIAKMSDAVRDDLDPAEAPGGWHAYNYYEAQKLLPKPSDKLKKLTDRNTFILGQDNEYLANVDGTYFGVNKWEDPDDTEDETKFVYAFNRLDDPLGKPVQTTTDQQDELFAEMRKYTGETARRSEMRKFSPDDIVTNPSPSRLAALLRLSRDNTLRYVVDEDGDFHFWDAWLATHKLGADTAGVPYDYRRRGMVTTRDDMPAFSFWDDGLSLSDMKRYMTERVLFPAPGQSSYVTGAEIKNLIATEDDALLAELEVKQSTPREIAADRDAEKAMRALSDFKHKHSSYFEFAHRTDPDGNAYPIDRQLDREATRLHQIAIAKNKIAADIEYEQRRSAVSPAPTLSTPRSRITGQPINQIWTDPDVTDWDDMVRKMQDDKIDTKRVLRAIRDAGVAIKEKFDAYMLETNYHGRAAARVDAFADGELRKLLEDMAMRKLSMQDLDDYLWARHAPERNARNRRSNPQITDGSGMSDAQAADILAGRSVTINGRDIQLSAAALRSAAAVAGRVDAITNGTLDMLVQYGLETQQTVDTWRRTYGSYIPLKRDMESDANYSGAFNLGNGTGSGFSVKGSASKRALGSKRTAIDILANVAMQRELAIARGEKNRVAQAVYGLALSAPNGEFWIPVNPELNKHLSPAALAKAVAELVALGVNPLDAQSLATEPVQRYTDPKTGLEMQRINPQLRGRDDVLSTRINGEDRYVFFSNRKRAQEMVRGLKNLDAASVSGALQVIAPVTRWFAAVNTQFNPVFGLTNGIRDFSTGMLNLSSTPLSADRGKIAGYAWDALKGIYLDLRDHRAGRTPRSQWAQLFEQFELDGGRTGYRDMFQTSADRATAIAKELEHAGKGKQWVLGGEKHSAVFGWLSDYNTAVENAMRLAAYKAALDKNMSRDAAASLAKNLTVNFNKKGLAATQTGALYAFFNAAVQGTARIAETVSKDGKLTDVGQKIVYGGMMLGVMQALMGALAGWDDDEPPQFAREKNFIIPVPGTDKYASIPMPLGFHVLPNIGRTVTEFMMSGFKDPGKRLVRLAGVVLDAFNPIGSGTLAQTLSPTIGDPIIALAENEDWTGKSIYKADFNKMHPTPGWTRTKDTASPPSKWLSYWTNYLTGGGKYEIGMASPTPDQIDYLVGQATGGVGRELLKTAQYASSKVTGEELPIYKTPLGVGRFVGETKGQSSETSKFYRNLERVGEHKSALEEMKDARDSAALQVYLTAHPEARLVQMADRAQREVGYLRRQKRELIEKGASRERIKLMDEKITTLTRRYNEMLMSR